MPGVVGGGSDVVLSVEVIFVASHNVEKDSSRAIFLIQDQCASCEPQDIPCSHS